MRGVRGRQQPHHQLRPRQAQPSQQHHLPGGASESFAYDANGNRKTLTTQDGKVTRYGYGKFNRLVNPYSMAEKVEVRMGDEMTTYKKFLDKVVGLKNSAEAQWVKQGNWPSSDDDGGGISNLLAKLSSAERGLIASMLEDARTGGLHDMLAMLQEDLDKKQIKITIAGVDLLNSPFGSELHYDFICRLNGDDWPDE